MDLDTINYKWMEAWAHTHMDSEVTVAGNGYDPGAVIATIYYCMSVLGMGADFAVEPTRSEIITWLEQNGQTDKIEYLVEDY